MSPSLNHEIIKEFIGYLIEAYCEKNNLDFYQMGSSTLKLENKKVGKEPDCSYSFGERKQIPDLAVEVVFSSGGLSDLEKYKLLDVKEVWFWLKDHLEIYCLEEDKYILSEKSINLARLNVNIVGEYLPRVFNESPVKLKKEFLLKI